MWSWTSRNWGKRTPVVGSILIQRAALGRPKRKMARPVSATDHSRSYPWSTKFLTQSSTVDIIDVRAAKESARKNTATIISCTTGPPGACANTSGRTRKVMAELPPLTAPSGSSETENTAIMTVSPAIMLMLLFARHMVAALSVVSSSFLMYTEYVMAIPMPAEHDQADWERPFIHVSGCTRYSGWMLNM